MDIVQGPERRAFQSPDLNNNSITERFGEAVFTRLLTSKEDLEPFVRLSNLVRIKKGIPGESDHRAELVICKAYDSESKVFSVFMEDKIFLDSVLPIESDRKALQTTLRNEVEEVSNGKKTLEQTKYLSKFASAYKDDPNWECQFDYYDGSTDGGAGDCGITFSKKESDMAGYREKVYLDVYSLLNLNVRIPLKGDFDKNIEDMRSVFRVISECLNLPYTPRLEYQFVYDENTKIINTAENSRSFLDYFYKNVENWKNIFRGEPAKIRAIIGDGNDGEPIILVEDSTLQSSRENSLDRFIQSYFSSLSLGAPLVFSHDDIYRAFSEAKFNRNIDSSMVPNFPDGDSRNWLHMFIDLPGDSRVRLIEDRQSNTPGERTNNLIKSAEEKYGIEYGGFISDEVAEKMAKSPMLLPDINRESAIIEKKYGSSSARAYRQSAIGWLMNGSLHSKEVYDAYKILLNATDNGRAK